MESRYIELLLEAFFCRLTIPSSLVFRAHGFSKSSILIRCVCLKSHFIFLYLSLFTVNVRSPSAPFSEESFFMTSTNFGLYYFDENGFGHDEASKS